MRRHHRALSDVEAASSFREIGDNQREQRAIEPGTYTIEQLHANKPMRIVREGVKHTANRQNEEAGEEQRFATPAVGLAPDQYARRNAAIRMRIGESE